MKNAHQATKCRRKNLCDFVAWCAFRGLSSKALLLLLCIVLLLFTGAFWKFSWDSKATGVPDTPDAKAIAAVLTQFYGLLDAPVTTIDAKEFAAVLLDRPEPPLTSGQQELLTKMVGEENAQNGGYLTYMMAEHRQLQQGEEILKTVQQKAKAENRAITADEWASMKQENRGIVPSGPNETNLPKTTVSLESIDFSGDQAIVRYNTQPAYEEATMLKVGKQWYIIGIRVIWAHF